MFRDSKGRWWLDFYSRDGKRHRKIAGDTKESADRLLREIRGTIDRGTYVDPHRSPAFSDFCKEFMERHGQHLASYEESSRLDRIKTFFGAAKLSTITSEHIEQYRITRLAELKDRTKKTMPSLSTVDREVAIIRALFSKARKWKKIATNPALAVEDYGQENKRERFLSNEEIRALKLATKRSRSPLLRAIIWLLLETGLRRGEAFALRWDDVHFDAGKILVRDSKSGAPRHVPLSRRARWLLRRLTPRDPLAASGWVFESVNVRGEKSKIVDVNTGWKRALRIARIDDFHIHDLRHTFASHFAMKGGNLFALAKILGHSNPKTTLERYAHLSAEFIADQRRVMDSPAFNSGVRSGVRSGNKQPEYTPPRALGAAGGV
jgi:integrase